MLPRVSTLSLCYISYVDTLLLLLPPPPPSSSLLLEEEEESGDLRRRRRRRRILISALLFFLSLPGGLEVQQYGVRSRLTEEAGHYVMGSGRDVGELYEKDTGECCLARCCCTV